uniref:FLZ-type domain-containing protein n=1 Tax=Oryza brachyantha TaxID=4533 RepID=J3MHM6_ORYBR
MAEEIIAGGAAPATVVVEEEEERGDAAFCSDECRQEQMDMDEALQTVARRHRLLCKPSTSPSAAEAAARPPMMHRRPTIANLAARTPVAATS